MISSMSVVEVTPEITPSTTAPVNEIINPTPPATEETKPKRTRKQKADMTPRIETKEIIVKEVLLEEKKVPKPKRAFTTEKQLEAMKKGQEALAKWRKDQREAKEALKAEAERKAQEEIARKAELAKQMAPDATVKVKPLRAKRGTKPKKDPNAPKKKPGRPRKNPLPEETSCTSEVAITEMDSESDTESDTDSASSEEEYDHKYVRKAERRIRAVKKIEKAIATHANPYFRNNLSIF